MNDRELLEMAAKAAGVSVVRGYFGCGECWLTEKAGFGLTPWNPLTDDGDALRLAADLSLCVFINGMFVHADCKHCPGGDIGYFEENTARNGGCIYAATRRAITRAAAEIGRAMQ